MALMAASAVCGAAVFGRDGQRLGGITELMVETDTGKIAYAVLTHGGVLGLGEKLFAVPWHVIEIDAVNSQMRVEADSAALDAAVGISKDAWPTEAHADWIA